MKICKLINGKIQNYRIVLRKKIAACSKFAVTLAITTICYWMRIHKEKNNIFFDFPIFWFSNFLYKFDASFFPTLHGFSIILANIKGRIKINDISNPVWPRILLHLPQVLQPPLTENRNMTVYVIVITWFTSFYL